MLTPRRWLVAALSLLVLAGCSNLPGGSSSPSPSSTSASPTLANKTLTTDSGKIALKLRNIASSAGSELAKINTGTSIIVECSVKGTQVSGTQGATAVWNRVTYQGKTGFVSAAYVDGGANPDIPDCPYVPIVADAPLPFTVAEGLDTRAKVLAIATSQLGVAEHNKNCNPYTTKCEEWCAHFATWVWQQAGVKIPDYAFTGDVYAWGKKNSKAHSGLTGIQPGDMVLYGTGPSNPSTSTHVDIVVSVSGNRLHVIGGNVDDRVSERDVPLSGIYGWVSLT